MNRKLWLLATLAICFNLFLVAQTCEPCKKAIETGEDVTAEICQCSEPCECFDKNCSCLWYGCCTELITSEEPQHPQPIKPKIKKAKPEKLPEKKLAHQKPAREIEQEPIISEETEKPALEKPALVVEEEKIIGSEKPETIDLDKSIISNAPNTPVLEDPALPEPEKPMIKGEPKKIAKNRVLKQEPKHKNSKHHDKSCAYCHHDKKAKKCTCHSNCHCIHNNCKCIQEGCQCGNKSVKHEEQNLTLKTNIPYTLLIKNEGDPQREWAVANRRIPHWLTIKKEDNEDDSAKFILTATQKGRMKLIIHYIGKDQKKATHVIRYRITVEKGLPSVKPVAKPKTAPVTVKPEAVM